MNDFNPYSGNVTALPSHSCEPMGGQGMKALLAHIQHQQDTATALCGILDALAIMDRGRHEQATVTSLIVVAGKLAASICRELDSVRLPEGGEA